MEKGIKNENWILKDTKVIKLPQGRYGLKETSETSVSSEIQVASDFSL